MDNRPTRLSYLREWAARQAGGLTDTAEDLLDVRVCHAAEDVRVVVVAGEVDLMTAPLLDTVVADQCASLPALLILDLRAVTFLGSSGLGSLLVAREAAATIGAHLRLVCAGPSVLRPIDLTGLTELFEVYTDLDAAVLGQLRS